MRQVPTAPPSRPYVCKDSGVDTEHVAALIRGGEDYTVEFKGESKSPLNDRDLIEAVVCLANGRGGMLMIGVEDDGRITGARPRHDGITVPARVQALIANKTIPPVAATVDLVEMAGMPVLAIEVEDASRVVGTSGGLYVRRALRVDGRPECVPYPAHEMLAHEIDRGALDYASLPAHGAGWDDLDPREFDRFRTLVGRAGAAGDAQLASLTDLDIARALGVVTFADGEPRPTTGAVLLFGQPEALRRFIPTHEAAFQVLRGNAVEVNDFVTGPLLKVADDLLTHFRVRNTQEEVQVGLLRIAIPLVPEVAVREAIANALVHREYTRPGPVVVRISDDALTVTNPGGFPPGVRLDNLLETSQPRSRVLADAFKRAGIVERTGRGINRMFEATLRLGRDAPDFSRSTEHSVTAVFPLSTPDIALARFVVEREQAGQPFRLEDLQVLNELRREADLSTSQAASLLQKTEAQTRAALARMVENGLVEARTGRGRRYHLSAQVYRALDQRAAYVRNRTFDALQQEQMVLAYVDAHASITRAEAAELCQLTSQQASQLLRRLAARGDLSMHGERRGAHYTKPPGISRSAH